MFVLGNLFEAIAVVLENLIQILIVLIFVRALLSWVSPDPYNPIVQFIERSTEWILIPLRQWIPAYRLGIDVSPMLAILLLYFLKLFIVKTLFGLSIRLK